VATPIGNLGDLSARARDTLAGAALIAAEDTRHTGTLLKAFRHRNADDFLARSQRGAARAGPHRASARRRERRAGERCGHARDQRSGIRLVRACAAAGIEVVAVPGPCALVAALSIAGLPTDRFCFEGFLPARGAARRTRLAELYPPSRARWCSMSRRTAIKETLEDCAEHWARARAALAREITKLHESLYRGSLAELATARRERAGSSRGEIVLVVAGAAPEAAARAMTVTAARSTAR
jgi:16S rRNA (cytidine1402-2'-O)-methyltransferase